MKKTVVMLIVAGVLVVAAAGVAIAYNIGNGEGEQEVPNDNVAAIDEEDNDEMIGQEETDVGDVSGILPGDDQDSNAIADIADFLSITGKVESIVEENGVTRVTIEDTDGNQAVLVINEETVFPFEKEFAVGGTITGWYRTNAPMILIWPPQYNIAVLAADAPEGSNIKVDRFTTWADREGGYMISQDKMFAFITDDETKIVLANGEDFTNGDIEGRSIIVIYDISTRSIPEMATANKLIVLYEDIVPLS